jgi:hypothetical protein
MYRNEENIINQKNKKTKTGKKRGKKGYAYWWRKW